MNDGNEVLKGIFRGSENKGEKLQADLNKEKGNSLNGANLLPKFSQARAGNAGDIGRNQMPDKSDVDEIFNDELVG